MYILSYSYLTENEKFNEKFLSEIEDLFRVWPKNAEIPTVT